MVGLAEQQSYNEQESSFSNEQEVGVLFRLAREEQKKTIEDVARITHIRRLYLTAIEEGRFDQLPGKVYVIGFIKAYAQLLGLDANELLRRLQLDGISSAQSSKLIIAVPTESQERPSSKLVILSSVLTLVLGGSLIVWTIWEKEVRQLWEHVTATQFPLTTTVETQSSSDEVITQEFKEEFSIPVDDAPTSPSIQSTSASEHTNDPVESSKALSPDPQTVKPVGGTLDKTDKIVIIAQKDSWVQVVDGQGKSIFVRLMHGGETFQIPSENGPYQLNAGNAGGIRLRLNDATTGFIGSEGKIIRAMPLVPDQIRQFGLTPDENASGSQEHEKNKTQN